MTEEGERGRVGGKETRARYMGGLTVLAPPRDGTMLARVEKLALFAALRAP